MEYKLIQQSLSDLYDYLLGIPNDIIESNEAIEVINNLNAFLTSLHLPFQMNQNKYFNEMSILIDINDGLFDLLEDYEDLEDEEFEKHINEYKILQKINCKIIEIINEEQVIN